MPANEKSQPAAWCVPGVIALGIESSNPSAIRHSRDHHISLGVCLARCEGIDQGIGRPQWRPLHVEPLRTDNPQHDDLAGCIARCATIAGITPRQIGAVCVSIGPGGFTGVRVAVVTAKMICEATGAACLGVPSAAVVVHALAERAGAHSEHSEHHSESRTTAIALASKSDNTFVTLFDQNMTPLRAGFLCDAKRLRDLCEREHVRTLVADHFLPPAMLEEATTLGMSITQPVFSPLSCVAAASRHIPIDPANLLPLYPREPEAVTKWRLLHG